MDQQTRRGALVVFEGIDGAGKTTQVEILASALRAAGEDVVVSKEPTRGPWGMKIRESAVTGRMSLAEELHAFEQDRHQHVREVIRPALDAGKIVILDRYFYSTIAYQGSRGGNPDELRERMRVFPTPDVVYVLDVEPWIGIERVSRRDGQPNHFEQVDQLERARQIFLTMNTQITEHVDGGQRLAGVTRSVLNHFLALGGPYQTARCAKHWRCEDPMHCTSAAVGECEWWARRRVLAASVTA